MNGHVAHFLDGTQFGKDVGAEVVLKGLFVNEGAEVVVVVGELQVGIVGVEPVNGLFEGVANVEATAAIPNSKILWAETSSLRAH
jgi:hypothetical protein